jgi:hypothetical protein
MTALRTPFRVRLLVEHLEDRSQPAAVSMNPLAGAVVLNPIDHLTPAIAGDRVAGFSDGAAMSPAAVAEPTLFILFGPDDEAEFAVLVEPAQAPSPPAETAFSIAMLEQQVGLRVVFVAVDFPGNNGVNFFTHHGQFVDQNNPGVNPPEGQATLPPPLPNHPSLGSDLDTLLIPAGAVNAVNRAEAPMPRAVEGPAVAPPVETAPPPREVRPEKNDPNPVSLAAPPSASEIAISNAAPVVSGADEPQAAVAKATPSAAAEQPENADRSWGFFGVCAAAISAGGYWMLHHSGIARAAKRMKAEEESLFSNPSL